MSEQIEPFGYFKCEPFGWVDCPETDEGAIPLYESQRAWGAAKIESLIKERDELQAQLDKQTERLHAIRFAMFESHWNGVIDSGSRTHWRVTSDYRHFVQQMEGYGFGEAIDTAIKQANEVIAKAEQ